MLEMRGQVAIVSSLFLCCLEASRGEQVQLSKSFSKEHSLNFSPPMYSVFTYFVSPGPELCYFFAIFLCFEKWKQTGVIKGRTETFPLWSVLNPEICCQHRLPLRL